MPPTAEPSNQEVLAGLVEPSQAQAPVAKRMLPVLFGFGADVVCGRPRTLMLLGIAALAIGTHARRVSAGQDASSLTEPFSPWSPPTLDARAT